MDEELQMQTEVADEYVVTVLGEHLTDGEHGQHSTPILA
jgi:hypothetical protein